MLSFDDTIVSVDDRDCEHFIIGTNNVMIIRSKYIMPRILF